MEDRAVWESIRARLRRPVVQDVVVAAVLACLSLVSLWSPPAFITFDFRDPDALGVVLSLVASASVTFRSRRPEAALLVSLAASIAVAQLGYSQSLGGVATLLTLYSVAVSRRSRVSVPLAALTVLAVGVVLVTSPMQATLSQAVANLFVIGTAWTVGRSVRVRRAHTSSIVAREQAQAAAYEAETRALLVEERALMAREMQDLVAHNLTEVGVQVAAARRLLTRGQVADAEQLLLDAERVSRSAMDEMRRAVRMLGRSDGDAGLRPQPGIGDLDELVRRAATEGTTIRFNSSGEPLSVSAGVALTAYRVVEESLQELRDSGRGSVDVAVDWGVDALSVSLRGEPADPQIKWDEPELPAGNRITRLRNRVETYGGQLGCCRTREGGLAVSARFPLLASGRTT
jgi:signal transduction histidine kinase